MTRLPILIFIFVGSGLLCTAQQVSGTVIDESGGTIAGAQITLFNAKDSSVMLRAVSNPRGMFTIHAADGEYALEILAPGFQKYLTDVRLSKKEDTSLQFRLKVKVCADCGQPIVVIGQGDPQWGTHAPRAATVCGILTMLEHGLSRGPILVMGALMLSGGQYALSATCSLGRDSNRRNSNFMVALREADIPETDDPNIGSITLPRIQLGPERVGTNVGIDGVLDVRYGARQTQDPSGDQFGPFITLTYNRHAVFSVPTNEGTREQRP